MSAREPRTSSVVDAAFEKAGPAPDADDLLTELEERLAVNLADALKAWTEYIRTRLDAKFGQRELIHLTTMAEATNTGLWLLAAGYSELCTGALVKYLEAANYYASRTGNGVVAVGLARRPGRLPGD